jgi:hypothetical protein
VRNHRLIAVFKLKSDLLWWLEIASPWLFRRSAYLPDVSARRQGKSNHPKLGQFPMFFRFDSAGSRATGEKLPQITEVGAD